MLEVEVTLQRSPVRSLEVAKTASIDRKEFRRHAIPCCIRPIVPYLLLGRKSGGSSSSFLLGDR